MILYCACDLFPYYVQVAMQRADAKVCNDNNNDNNNNVFLLFPLAVTSVS